MNEDVQSPSLDLDLGPLDVASAILPADDGAVSDALLITFPNGMYLEVYSFVGFDGVPVVHIDAEKQEGRIRVSINDGDIWDGNPWTDAAPGATYWKRP